MYYENAKVAEGLAITSKEYDRTVFDLWAGYDVAAQITRFSDEAEYGEGIIRPDGISIFGYATMAEGLLVNTGGNYTAKALRESSAASGSQPNTSLKFTNADSKIGVGDSTTAAAVAQTDLQAASNKLRKAVDATFPLLVGDQYTRANPTTGATETVTLTDRQIVFRSTYASSEANYSWQEFAIFNAASGGTMLDRFVSNQGTKVAGQVWEVTITLTFS